MVNRFRSLPFRALYAISFVSFLFMALMPSVALGLPLVAITRPTQGAVVSGVILIDVAFRSDSNRPITRLEIYIDDSLAREADLASPLLEGRQSFNWDFSYLSNSVHKISARAVDSAGNANTASVNVNVQNAAATGPDQIPPVVRIYYPAQGAKVSGMVEIKAEANDNVGVELVYFYIDGRLHKMIMKAPPYVDQWDTTREADGTHVLEAVAVDAAENEARSAQVTVIVENHSLTTMAPAGTTGVTPSPLPNVGPVAGSEATAGTTSSSTMPSGAPAVAAGPWVPQIDNSLSAPGTMGLTVESTSPAASATQAPAVRNVTPRSLPLGPVPQAPMVTELPGGPDGPLTLAAETGTAPATVVAPVGPAASPQASLPRPPSVAMAAPQATTGTMTAPKASAPTLQPMTPVATTSTSVAAAPPTLAAAEPAQTGSQAPVTRAPQTVSAHTGPQVSSSGLTPLTATNPPLTSASKPVASPAKSSAPAGYAPTLAMATTLKQQVTPTGPTVASAAGTVSLSPIVAVAPTPRAVPTGIEALKTTPPAQATLAPAGSPPAGGQIASLSRPPITPARLTEAVFAECKGTPIPAQRMLARLPDHLGSQPLAADGRITSPAGQSVAAVPVAVATVRDIRIVFDGEVLSLRTSPETRQGISLAPLREIFEQAEGTLYWFPVEKEVHAVNKSSDVRLRIGDPQVTVNGQTQTLEVAPFIKQGRTMVPLQFIADILDVSINFDNRTGQILISSNQF